MDEYLTQPCQRDEYMKAGLYKLSTKKWPKNFVYMADDSFGYLKTTYSDPGPAGVWRIEPFETDQQFRISTERWRGCFAYVQSGLAGWVAGSYRQDPGPQGYFKFIPRMDNGECYYLITPTKWENEGWFLYVEMSGNVSTWKGDPGPQGWFKLDRWDTTDCARQALERAIAELDRFDREAGASGKILAQGLSVAAISLSGFLTQVRDREIVKDSKIERSPSK